MLQSFTLFLMLPFLFYQSHARTPKSSVLCVIVFGRNLDEVPKVHLCYQLMDGQLFWILRWGENQSRHSNYRAYFFFLLGRQSLPISIIRKQAFKKEIMKTYKWKIHHINIINRHPPSRPFLTLLAPLWWTEDTDGTLFSFMHNV